MLTYSSLLTRLVTISSCFARDLLPYPVSSALDTHPLTDTLTHSLTRALAPLLFLIVFDRGTSSYLTGYQLK
jgi:hypothetical protein